MATWKDKTLLVIDTETTGLEHGKERVIEVAWLLWRQGVVLESHSALLDPHRELSEKIVELTGISDEMLRGAREFEDVVRDLDYALLFADAIVAYNAPFDVGRLRYEFHLAGADWPGTPALDPLVWTRHYDKYECGKKLTQVAERLGVQAPGQAHRALTDCHLCAGVMAHYMSRLLEDLGDLIVWQDRKRAEQEADFQAWKSRQGAVA